MQMKLLTYAQNKPNETKAWTSACISTYHKMDSVYSVALEAVMVQTTSVCTRHRKLAHYRWNQDKVPRCTYHNRSQESL